MAICTPDTPLHPFAKIMRQSSKRSPCICLVSFTNYGGCHLLKAADQAAVGISLPFLLPRSAPALYFTSFPYRTKSHGTSQWMLLLYPSSPVGTLRISQRCRTVCMHSARPNSVVIFPYFPPRLDSRNRTFFLTEFPDTISMTPHYVPPSSFQISTHRRGRI